RYLLLALQIREPVLNIAGGVVLFLIVIRMIFTPEKGIFGATVAGEPLVVPIATPLLAGPSAIAVVLLLASNDPGLLGQWCAALGVVLGVTTATLVGGVALFRVLGQRGAVAVQKLMGMILIAVAIQLFIGGIERYLGM
ncbi:MAG: MarC family protein, partial [Chloroflexota bacterium]